MLTHTNVHTSTIPAPSHFVRMLFFTLKYIISIACEYTMVCVLDLYISTYLIHSLIDEDKLLVFDTCFMSCFKYALFPSLMDHQFFYWTLFRSISLSLFFYHRTYIWIWLDRYDAKNINVDVNMCVCAVLYFCIDFWCWC